MGETSTKLTKRAVDAAAPKEERYLLWDSELKGFALRVAPSGTKTYIVRYRPRGLGAGAPKRFVVVGRHGPLTPDEARARAKALLGAVAAGQDPARASIPAPDAITIAGLVDLFIEEHVRAKRKGGTAIGYAAVLRANLVPRFGKQAADKLTAADLAQIHLAMRDRPYQANRLLSITASMYGFAGKRGLVPRGTNPAAGVERFASRRASAISRPGNSVAWAKRCGWRRRPDCPGAGRRTSR